MTEHKTTKYLRGKESNEKLEKVARNSEIKKSFTEEKGVCKYNENYNPLVKETIKLLIDMFVCYIIVINVCLTVLSEGQTGSVVTITKAITQKGSLATVRSRIYTY